MTKRAGVWAAVVAAVIAAVVAVAWPRADRAVDVVRDAGASDAAAAPTGRELARKLVEDGRARGLVVALIRRDEVEYLELGARSETDARPPTRDTAFEIASLSKPFTALLLADQVVRGDVDLDGAVSPALPITFRQLATHTSGLPRVPPDMPLTMDDPYAAYTAAQIDRFLAGFEPPASLPAPYEYSNLGYGVLGEMLGRRADSSLAALLSERIATPLGLSRTAIGVPAAAGDDVAVGHDDALAPAPAWTPGALAGAYAVHSTARDLATFVRAQLREPDGTLGEAIRLTQRPHADYPGGRIGLGWHIGASTGAHWHNGQSAGFASFVAFDRSRGVGVVVLANARTSYVDAVGKALYTEMAGL